MTEGNHTDNMYWSAISLLPRRLRPDVRTLFRLVYTLQTSSRTERRRLQTAWRRYQRLTMSELSALSPQNDRERLATSVCRLMIVYRLEVEWIEVIFATYISETDTPYTSDNQTMRYLYGNAEVLGVILAQILKLPRRQVHAASLLARAAGQLQLLVNLDKASAAGQSHFAKPAIDSVGLEGVDPVSAHAKPAACAAFVREQLRLYNSWQSPAERSLHRLPKAIRPAVRFVIEGHRRQAKQMVRDPLRIYRRPPRLGTWQLRAMQLIRRFD